MRNQVFKKLFSALLALIMVAGLLPASVLAEGWGEIAPNAETTPAATAEPTAEPAETTEPTDEPVETAEPTAEPAEGEETAEPVQEETPAPEEGILLAAETGTANEINYETKVQSVPLPDAGEMGYRIVHIDCGRKYFSEAQIKQIIDYAYDYGYTHVELAFGNDGLRFLLNNMDVTANGTTYFSDSVKSAIQNGNDAFDNAASNSSLANSTEELTQDEMDNIISYAKTKGIGIIPMFDAPGHLYAVITAMNKIFGSNISSSKPSDSGESPNMAIDPTEAASVNFVQALMKKYIEYFAKNGCKIFNIAADECGFSKMDETKYTAYVKMVNSMAAMVQNEGMTALAFNDGIYHKNLTTNVEFDTNIAICYWDASTDKYASAATLADKGFEIINTHNKWYYVIGAQDNGWYGATWSIKNMNGTGASDCIADKCDFTDGGYQTKYGCMNAIWCDTPSNDTNMTTIEEHIKALSVVEYNKTFFKQVEAPKTPAVTVSDENKTVKEATKTADNTYKVVLKKATEGTAESQTLLLTVANGAEGAQYSWTSNNEKVATVENGLVTFVGSSGTVTITATPKAATATKGETAVGYSITFSVAKEGEVAPVTKDITVTIGATFEDKIEGDVSNNIDETNYNRSIATYTVEVKDVTASAGDPVKQETIQAGGKYIIGDNNGNYIKLNGTTITNTNNQDEATEWTIESNTTTDGTAVWNIKSGNYYLSYYYNNSWGLYVKTSAEQVSWAYDGTGFKYYTTFNGNSYYLRYYNSKWTVNKTNSYRGAAYVKGTPTEAGKQTTVTIKGVAEGDTTVKIGHVTYNVHVITEDLTKAKKFYIQLWSTNITIEGDGKFPTTSTTSTWNRYNNDKRAKYVTVTADKAYGEKGVLLSELVPESMGRYEEGGTYWVKEQTSKSKTDLVLLKGKALTGQNNLQYVWDNDHCNDSSGTEFMYVRYFDGKWAVSPDGTDESWTEITNCIQNAYTETGYQVIAYYRIRTQVVDEVYTDLDEWATIPHTTQEGGYCLLDFRVKDDTGRVDPTNFPVEGKTMGFACGSGVRHSEADADENYYRMLNSIAATAKEGYEIYMVTLTPTSDTHTETLGSKASYATNYQYKGTEKVVWVLSEDELPDEFRNEAKRYTESPSGSASTYTVGGKPDLASVEIYQGQGLLVTYYIRQIKNDESLTVHYREDNGKEEDFYYYNINVKNGVFFNSNIALGNPTKGYLQNGEVTNKEDKIEKVTSDLSAMIKVPAQYRYAQFECVRMTRLDENGNVVSDGDTSTNVKEVVLYYTLSYQVTLVLDFGLSLVITPGDVNSTLKNANITKTEIITQPNFATASLEGNNVRYTLTKTISEMDNLTVKYTGENIENDNEVGSVTYTVTIIPATTVYYEDSFATFTNGSGAAEKATWTIVNNDGATLNEQQQKDSYTTQALEALGKKENVYGYDDAYKDSTMFSMGSARKVTVTNDMVTNWTDTSTWPTAQFTFKGTGFDIISLTDNTSGAIFVFVYEGTNTTSTGKRVKSYVVDNYYGYTYDETTKTWSASPNGENNALYQIPVMRIRDLEYGEYTAVIKVFYDDAFDHTKGQTSYSFWLDAVRVYDPMGKSENTGETYGQDGEAYPQYIKLRSEIKKLDEGKTVTSGALFIDGKENATIAEYSNYGPNNEVYLASGQAITFKLNIGNAQIETVQIGAKAPNGSPVMKVNGTVIKGNSNTDTDSLDTATEMYYDITTKAITGSGENVSANSITITNTDTGILSLTNLKITFTSKPNAEVTLAKLNEAEQHDAVATVRALFAPAPVEPEPEKTFEPERFEASWTKNVMQGRKATLTVKTSEDVEAITVDGQTVSSYRTRTERVGFGRRAKRITYREFTYSMVAQESADFSVTAINAEGTESEAITARLTVKTRPNSMRDMWDWFKGWF